MNAKKIIIKLSMIVAGAGIIYAFYNYYKREMQLAMSFCYKFSKVKIVKASKDQFIINLTIKIRNQSDLRINLQNYSFEVYINGKFITVISSVSSVDLLANAVSELPVRIEFNPQKLFNIADVTKLIATALTDQNNFKIQLKGKIAAAINFIKIKDLPIDMTMSLAEIMKPADPNAPAKLDCKIV